jgi:hypothetical protein
LPCRQVPTVVADPATSVSGQQLAKKTHKEKVGADDDDLQASTAKGKERAGNLEVRPTPATRLVRLD